MENLTKQQIVLLTLLVSFVTSIATGIVTVTLLEQAPPGVTQTINRVVERTVERVVPGKDNQTVITKEVVVREGDLVADSVEQNLPYVVDLRFIKEGGEEASLGIGTLISNDGIIATDKRNLTGIPQSLFIVYKGIAYPVVALPTVPDADVSFLKIDNIKIKKEDQPTFSVHIGDPGLLRLGQTVAGIGGIDRNVLVGIISRINKQSVSKEATTEDTGTESVAYFETDISFAKGDTGGPIVDVDGNIVGISIFSSIQTISGKQIVIPIKTLESLIVEEKSKTASTGS